MYQRSMRPSRSDVTRLLIRFLAPRSSSGGEGLVLLTAPGKPRLFYFSPPPKEPTMEDIITLACTVCKRRNYTTLKNKKNDPDRLELSKYCRWCHKHTAHKETK